MSPPILICFIRSHRNVKTQLDFQELGWTSEVRFLLAHYRIIQYAPVLLLEVVIDCLDISNDPTQATKSWTEWMLDYAFVCENQNR